MSMNRRDFLKGTAWMGAAAMAASCANTLKFCGNGGMMNGFAAAVLAAASIVPMRRSSTTPMPNG